MRLKRWESPRREGRNDKGRGGSARQRQLKKQRQMLRKKLKDGNNIDNKDNHKDKNKQNGNKNNGGGREKIFPFFCEYFPLLTKKHYFLSHFKIIHHQWRNQDFYNLLLKSANSASYANSCVSIYKLARVSQPIQFEAYTSPQLDFTDGLL
jgi:hypothetical protein